MPGYVRIERMCCRPDRQPMPYAAGMADVLLLDRADGVATLTLNRPESIVAEL